MKGIVFTEFLEMVEEQFSAEVADELIETTELESGGVYTSVGTYRHEEIVALIGALSALEGRSTADLLRTFGTHLFGRFNTNYPQFFEGNPSVFEFLESVEGYIHVEVRKLYPNAELPTFATSREGDALVMDYSSPRRMADLAEGLILGCGQHFDEPLTVERERVSDDGARVRFVIRKKSPD